ncbi:MAG: hypothetical protein ACRDOK_16480 [Streptosporangiaceae bacterium]
MRRFTPNWTGLAAIGAAAVTLGFAASGASAAASPGGGPAGPLPYRGLRVVL